jgi:DNA-binding GntR family transcriptional regulator
MHMNGEQEGKLKALLERHAQSMPLGDAVYHALREAITTNVLAESERISGYSLATKLKASRTPIREALRRLESERLVTAVSGAGFVVTRMTVEDIEEIYTLRVALEGCAASLAARYRTPGDLMFMESLHQAFLEAANTGDVRALAQLNTRFHDAICSAAKSVRLREMVRLLQESVRRLGPTTLESPERIRQSVAEHGDLLAAIRDGDPVRAETRARVHMEHAHEARLRQCHGSLEPRLQAG